MTLYQPGWKKNAAGEALLSIIPLIIIYAIFQNQFIEGIALTGIKG